MSKHGLEKGEESKMGSPLRQKDSEGRGAICSFRDRVCHRFDLTHELLIFHGKCLQREPIEKVDVARVSPEKVLDVLLEKEVTVAISGGIQERFQEMLRRNDIDVIWGVAAEVCGVVEAYAKGILYSGIGPLSIPKGPR